MVEHDEYTIRHADHIVDLGPGAGERGRQCWRLRHTKRISGNPNSLTGQYLNQTLTIPLPEKRRAILSEKLR